MINTLIILLVLALVLYLCYFVVGKFIQGTPLQIIGIILGLDLVVICSQFLGNSASVAMSVTYKAKNLLHITSQGEIWDICSIREYGDEHCMHHIQDANFDHRFVDEFPGNIVLDLPQSVTINRNLKARRQVPNLKELLPWL